MANIPMKYITDKDGNKVLPITNTAAVRDDQGNNIGTLLGAEASARQNADSGLASQISAEQTARQNADSGLQNSIAAETSRAQAAEANRYTKSETYTKTEVNGLVDTPHQNYVTVLTYSALPASGSTDTIYRVSNYDGSVPEVNVTKYSEYAWNGSAYIFLCVKSQIDEVFDITVYNSNTKYADLTAALGTGGANIPETLRRGGMSVKYVQSSDNKYVQYRYMGTEVTGTPNPFLYTDNWQGLDKEPILNSNNLVKSGGVYAAIGLVYNFNGTLSVQSGVQYIVGPVWYLIEETNYLIVQLHNISTNGDLSVHCLDTDGATQYQLTVFPIVEDGTYIIVNPNGKNIKGLRLLATDVTVAGNIDIEVIAKGLQRDVEKHISNKDNPHSVTKTQVGLGNVDNTSDKNKQTSYPTQFQIDNINNKLGLKVDGEILNKIVSGTGKYDIDDVKSFALNRCVYVGQGEKIKISVGEDYLFAINGYSNYVDPSNEPRTGYQGGYEYNGKEIVSNFNYISIYGKRIDGGDVNVNDVSIHIKYVEDAVLPVVNNLSFKKGIGCLDYQPIIKNGVNLILETGQSLSVGQSSTAYTFDTVDGAYMVGTKVSFISWQEPAVFNPIKAVGNEDQIVTCTQAIRKLAINNDSQNEEYCGVSCGIGGVPIQSLITTYKAWYQRQITKAAQAAQAANKELVCPIILFSQGESDYDDIANSVYRDASTYQDRVNLYKTRLLTLKSDIDNELSTQIGQDAPPIMFVTTPQGRYNKHERLFVHQALFEASMENYNIVLIGSAYFAPEFGGRHLSGNGYRWMGELCAKQIYETFKTKFWNAAFPTNYRVTENTIDVFTGANSNLIKDTSLVLPKYACGFNIALPPYNLALIDKVETHGNVISLKVSKQLIFHTSKVSSSYFDNYTLEENGLVGDSSSTHCSTTTRIEIAGGAGSYFRVVTLAGFYYRIFYYNTNDNTVPAIDSESGWFEDGQIFLSKGNYIGIEIVSGYGGKDNITKYSLDITIQVYKVSKPIVNLKTFVEENDCIISYAKDTAGEGNIRDTNAWCSRTSYLDDSEEISSTTGEGYISYTPDIVGEKYPIYNWLIPFDKIL